MENCLEESKKVLNTLDTLDTLNTLDTFLSSIKKLNQHREHKVTNSIGIYDAYKFLRKNKWLNIGRPLTEHEFYSIIRKVNTYLADRLIHGEDIKLPYRMGKIELRKYNANFSFDDNKIKTNLPIDWNRTLKLWYEDEESYKKKTLIKMAEKEIFKVYYNKQSAKYNNKAFYEFNVNRELKKKLKERIKEGKIDAFKLKRDELE